MTLAQLLNQKNQLKKSIVIMKMQGIDHSALDRELAATEMQIDTFAARVLESIGAEENLSMRERADTSKEIGAMKLVIAPKD
jgi:hypothetical protein